MQENYKIAKTLFVGVESGDKKINWIRWEEFCKSKEERGLEIRDIEKFNTTLLASVYGD